MNATAIRERPILFSAPMVRALLDGTKTQTRRLMKPQPTHGIVEGRAGLTIGMDPALDGKGWYDTDCIGPGRLVACPYGGIGDRLWVRETIQFVGATAVGDLSVYVADGSPTKADGWPWRRDTLPSIHCPRGLSRITLELTDVRVERLQDISDADARAEGITVLPLQDADDPSAWWQSAPGQHQARTPSASYAKLWDAINAKRGYGWQVNPWLWVLTFRRVTDGAARA